MRARINCNRRALIITHRVMVMKNSNDLLDADDLARLVDCCSEPGPSPHDDLERRQLVTTLLRTLSPREERVIRLYYGIGPFQMNGREIAEHLGVSPARANELVHKATRKMRWAGNRIEAAPEARNSTAAAYTLPRPWANSDDRENAYFLERLNYARGVTKAPAGKAHPTKKAKSRQKPRSQSPRAPQYRSSLQPACVPLRTPAPAYNPTSVPVRPQRQTYGWLALWLIMSSPLLAYFFISGGPLALVLGVFVISAFWFSMGTDILTYG